MQRRARWREWNGSLPRSHRAKKFEMRIPRPRMQSMQSREVGTVPHLSTSASSQRLPHLSLRRSHRSRSTPTRMDQSDFYPLLQRVPATTISVSALLHELDGSVRRCILNEHTYLELSKFKWNMGPGRERIQCVSVEHIFVRETHRRQGYARKALELLRLVAADHHLSLVVQNVQSPHMHDLVEKLDGRCLNDGRAGEKGCHYVLPLPPASRGLSFTTPCAPCRLPTGADGGTLLSVT